MRLLPHSPPPSFALFSFLTLLEPFFFFFFLPTECIELVDAAFMRATMAVGNPARKYDIADHLFFRLQGSTPGTLAESVEVVKKVVKKHGGDKFWPAKTEEEAEAVWTDRKIGLYSGLAYAGEGAKAWATDVWWARGHRVWAPVAHWMFGQCPDLQVTSTRARDSARH